MAPLGGSLWQWDRVDCELCQSLCWMEYVML